MPSENFRHTRCWVEGCPRVQYQMNMGDGGQSLARVLIKFGVGWGINKLPVYHIILTCLVLDGVWCVWFPPRLCSLTDIGIFLGLP